MKCPKCNCKLTKETGENNFYEGLFYCYNCDTYYTENGIEIEGDTK